MSVVVRMEMPKDECQIAYRSGGKDYCSIEGKRCEFSEPIGSATERPNWCPILCELPKEHGRLVDADELSKYWKCRIALMNSCSGKRGILESVEASTLKSCIEDMGSAKTIVPAAVERSET